MGRGPRPSSHRRRARGASSRRDGRPGSVLPCSDCWLLLFYFPPFCLVSFLLIFSMFCFSYVSFVLFSLLVFIDLLVCSSPGLLMFPSVLLFLASVVLATLLYFCVCPISFVFVLVCLSFVDLLMSRQPIAFFICLSFQCFRVFSFSVRVMTFITCSVLHSSSASPFCFHICLFLLFVFHILLFHELSSVFIICHSTFVGCSMSFTFAIHIVFESSLRFCVYPFVFFLFLPHIHTQAQART